MNQVDDQSSRSGSPDERGGETLPGSLPCARCGKILRDMKKSDECAKCGLSADVSLAPHRLAFAGNAFLDRLIGGSFAVAAGTVLAILIYPFAPLSSPAAVCVLALGLVSLSARQGGEDRLWPDMKQTRKLLKIAAWVFLVIVFPAAFFVEAIGPGLLLLHLLLGIPALSLAFRYIGQFAEDWPLPGIARDARCVAVCGFVAVSFILVGIPVALLAEPVGPTGSTILRALFGVPIALGIVATHLFGPVVLFRFGWAIYRVRSAPGREAVMSVMGESFHANRDADGDWGRGHGFAAVGGEPHRVTTREETSRETPVPGS